VFVESAQPRLAPVSPGPIRSSDSRPTGRRRVPRLRVCCARRDFCEAPARGWCQQPPALGRTDLQAAAAVRKRVAGARWLAPRGRGGREHTASCAGLERAELRNFLRLLRAPHSAPAALPRREAGAAVGAGSSHAAASSDSGAPAAPASRRARGGGSRRGGGGRRGGGCGAAAAEEPKRRCANPTGGHLREGRGVSD